MDNNQNNNNQHPHPHHHLPPPTGLPPPYPTQNPYHNLLQQQQQQLRMFWNLQRHEMEQQTDFKTHQLPLARIKKIMKADEDVRMISAEAPVLFSKACELFILELTMRSWLHAEENKRRTLQKNDIAASISRTDIFDFLVDIVPREDNKDEVTGLGGLMSSSAAGASGSGSGSGGGGGGPYYYPNMGQASQPQQQTNVMMGGRTSMPPPMAPSMGPPMALPMGPPMGPPMPPMVDPGMYVQAAPSQAWQAAWSGVDDDVSFANMGPDLDDGNGHGHN